MSARLSGAIVLSAGNAARILTQVAMVPILASLLGPEQFGLMALAMPFILFINLFSHGGLEKVVARQASLDEAFVSTAFWLSSMLGGGLAIIALLLALAAPLVSHGEALRPLLLGLLPLLVLSALCATPNGAIIRHERFKAFAIADIVSTLAGGAVALTLALHGWGVWALVVQQNILWLTRLAIVLKMSGVRPRRTFKPRLLLGHTGFALATLGIDLAEFLGRSLDNVLIGLFLGPAALAIYAMAYQLISTPALLVSGPIYVAMFSTFSRLAQHDGSVAEAYLQALRIVALIVLPLLLGMGLVGDPAFGLLLGQEWHDTSRLLRFLVPAGICFCLMTVNSAVMVATGHANTQLRIALATNAGLVIAILLGVGSQLRWIVAVCVSTALVLSLAGALVVVARTLRFSAADLFHALKGPFGGGLALLAAGLCVEAWIAPDLEGWTRVAAVTIAGALAYAVGLMISAPRAFKGDLETLKAYLWRRRTDVA